jgi:Leucine-rich repeat (LRR) protein
LLFSNNTTGTITKDIKYFKILPSHPLEVLHIDSNNFNGMLPKEFFSLKSLRRLWMESNYFTGNIEYFTKLKLLKTLVLGNNQFGEEIPDNLVKLKSLQVLRVNDNRFVGVFPIHVLYKMKALKEFNCMNNRYMNQNSIKRVMEWVKENGLKSSR